MFRAEGAIYVRAKRGLVAAEARLPSPWVCKASNGGGGSVPRSGLAGLFLNFIGCESSDGVVLVKCKPYPERFFLKNLLLFYFCCSFAYSCFGSFHVFAISHYKDIN